MQLRRKTFLRMVCFLFSILLATSKVLATGMTPVHENNAKYSRGVGNTCYWISSTASAYTSWIANAASLWNYNGYSNPIHMTAVSSNYGTHMDFYAHHIWEDSYLNSNINAYTTFFDSQGIQMYPSSDYFFTRIIINLDGSATQGTMCHEMGHSFGLKDDNSNTYSIMYVPASQRMVSSPQECDVNAINYLYGYGG